MKFLRLLWLNGEVIRAEHLNAIYSDIENWISKMNLPYGILNLNIDLLALKEGNFKVNAIEAVLNDLTYVNAKNLTLSLSNVFKKSYISIQYANKNNNINSTKSTEDELIINWMQIEPMFELVLNDSFPIAEIEIVNGEYVLTSFEPKFIKYSDNNLIISKCKQLILIINRHIEKLKYSDQKENIEIYTLSANEIFIACQLLNYSDIYSCLMRALTYISKNNHMILINSPNALNEIIEKIEYYLSINNANDYIQDFILKDNIYSAPITKLGKIKLIIEPANKDVKNWIENTVIASQSMFELARMKRVRGIDRIIESESSLIVELSITSEYFIMNQDLCILGDLCLSRISLYIS